VNPRVPLNSDERGKWAEDLACRFLRERGLEVLARNYRCKRGEIDLVMRDGDTIAFVEVRYRRRSDYGTAAQSVDHRKQKRIVATAEHYLAWQGRSREPCRFDLVCVAPQDSREGLTWIRDAFRA